MYYYPQIPLFSVPLPDYPHLTGNIPEDRDIYETTHHFPTLHNTQRFDPVYFNDPSTSNPRRFTCPHCNTEKNGKRDLIACLRMHWRNGIKPLYCGGNCHRGNNWCGSTFRIAARLTDVCLAIKNTSLSTDSLDIFVPQKRLRHNARSGMFFLVWARIHILIAIVSNELRSRQNIARHERICRVRAEQIKNNNRE
jgi:hypothetical protein